MEFSLKFTTANVSPKKLYIHFFSNKMINMVRGGSRAAATSKMECFVIIVNGWKPLTIITKHSILDVAAAPDPLLMIFNKS